MKTQFRPELTNRITNLFSLFLPAESRSLIDLEQAFPGIKKQIIAPEIEIPTPEVMSMQFLPAASYLRKPIYTIPEDYVVILSNVLFCPQNNVLLSDDGRVVAETLSTGINEVKAFRRQKIKDLPGTYTLFRSRKNGFYHTLIDNLPRIVTLKERCMDDIGQVRVLCSEPLSAVEKLIMSHFCRHNTHIIDSSEHSLLRLERVIFSSFKTRRFAGYLPERYSKGIRQELLENDILSKTDRIYVSREKAKKRRILNEGELASVLKKHGFRKVILEDHPFREQIKIFQLANNVVSPHGAGLSNLIFSTNAHVLELFPNQYVSPHYYYLCKSLGHRYDYMYGPEPTRDSNFSVDPDRLDEVLKHLE